MMWWLGNRQVIRLLQQILQKQENTMAELSDVSDALDSVSRSVSDGFQKLTSDLQTLLTDLGADRAKVQAIVDSVTNLGTAIQGNVDGLDAAIKAADPGQSA